MPCPRQKRIGEADFVLVDWGANEGLYRSDLTRVLVTGKISPKFERIYQVVLEAQARAIAAIRPGVVAHDVDNVARDLYCQGRFRSPFSPRAGPWLGPVGPRAPRLAVKNRPSSSREWS